MELVLQGCAFHSPSQVSLRYRDSRSPSAACGQPPRHPTGHCFGPRATIQVGLWSCGSILRISRKKKQQTTWKSKPGICPPLCHCSPSGFLEHTSLLGRVCPQLHGQLPHKYVFIYGLIGFSNYPFPSSRARSDRQIYSAVFASGRLSELHSNARLHKTKKSPPHPCSTLLTCARNLARLLGPSSASWLP